ncbi:hypothetical protein [Sphingomonas abaci]|uniref:Uncharacterized protein n=1 Tax=Sphingomonas abaci TaxID=237611 RepID=A0A7W7AF91_9SPHN|nr:hypothetical protein [Sphingomonas abaci]MBB4615939.1 hypothetical protein [Sphingomonas abaci]
MSDTSDRQARRRWLTIAEIVAVAGVIIAGLSLWNNWQDRRDATATKAAERIAGAQERRRYDVQGVPGSGGEAIELASDDAHPLTDIRVTFPGALGVGTKDVVDRRIPLDWFVEPLRKATDGGADEGTGRVPVLVRYTYLVDDRPVAKRAIYDLVWRSHGRPLRGRGFALVDFRLRQPGGDQARLDSLWRAGR